MSGLPIDPSATGLLQEFERKYMWWRPVGRAAHAPERVVAQVMNLGTYADIRRLETAFAPKTLADVARGSPAGWFSPRSWEFWRGRLAAARIEIPPSPPERSFGGP